MIITRLIALVQGNPTNSTGADIASSVNALIDNRGFIDYSDLATATTPVSVSAATVTALPNDGAGAQSISTYKPNKVTELMNVANGQLDFSELDLGDEVMVRVGITITTLTANTDVTVGISFAIGGTTPFPLEFLEEKPFKTAKTHKPQLIDCHFYMGSADVINNPAAVIVEADKAIEVQVDGFYISLR